MRRCRGLYFCSILSIIIGSGLLLRSTKGEIFSPAWNKYLQISDPVSRLDYATSKLKRHAEKSLDSLSPINPHIYPAHFGALNISWDPPTTVPRSQIHHYEVLLRNLTNPEHIRWRICFYYKSLISELDSEISTSTHIVVPSASPLDRPHLQLTEMLPDTFYSVEVRTVLNNGTVSQPTVLPSSPLVPADPPSGHPIQLQLTELSAQSAKVMWRLPQDIECNGELKGFTIELNSSYETNQHFTISPDATEYTLTELMQGTDYSLRISAITRGGQGHWSPQKLFRTHGEARIIDIEAFITTGLSTLPSHLASQLEQPRSDLEEESDDLDMVNRQAEYKVPDKIMDFRGQGLVKAIRLSWRIKWRRQRTPQRQVGWYDGDPDDSIDKVTVESVDGGVDHLTEAPNVMLRLIWWQGDSEPAEEMISASFSFYTLQNLRAGTPYHFRLIAIIPGEDGPSAHTVATPKHRNKDNQDTSRSHPIPVNLLVYRITPTDALLQWELPPDSRTSGIVGYQVRYQATRKSDSEGDFISILASASPPNLVNVSDPSAMTVTLRHLQPETVYEFAVRAVSRTAEPTKYWSMVQGFETPGQRPEIPPQNITISAVMSGYPSVPSSDSLANRIQDGKRDPSTDTGSASILVTWQSIPSVGSRGIYHIYFALADEFTPSRGSTSKSTLNAVRKQRRWSEHSVSGGQNSTVVNNLRTGQPYFLLMSAQNRHGRSPLSSLNFFRTADADGSGFINLNMLSESYEMGKMTPARIQRLSEEIDVLLKSLRSPESTQSSEAANSNDLEYPNQWILVSAVLAVAVVIVIILIVTILVTRRCTRTRMDRVRKEYYADANQRMAEKAEINSPMTQISHNSHHSDSPSCCDGRYAHRMGSNGLESLIHGPPPPLPPMNFDSSGVSGGGGFSPYTGLPFMMGAGGSAGGSGSGIPVSASLHNQQVLVHSPRGHAASAGVPTCRGSESDCRTTPIDSDLESAKSANLVSSYPYHHHTYLQQQSTLSPGQMRGSTGSPAHAGLLNSPEIRDGKRRSFRNYQVHQPVPLPPKMENLFTSASPSSSKSSSRQGPLILPYRDLGRLDTPPSATNISNESAEASRSTAGSSGYDSGAATNTTNGNNQALTQLPGVGERSLTESFIARQSQRLDTSHSVNYNSNLPRKFMSPRTPTTEIEHSITEDSRYQNHATIKLNSSNNLLQIPRISALDEQNLPKVYSTEELTEEMANLEGLMKNLTAITQKDFDCSSEL